MHEDDDPVLCPFLHSLATAFSDRAFAAEDLQSAEQFQRVRVEPSLRCQIFHWKESMLDVPGSRQSVKTAQAVRTSSDRAWKYERFRLSLKPWVLRPAFKTLSPCIRVCDKARNWAYDEWCELEFQ